MTRLLPVLGRSTDIGFNVFDVMHHGLHEKQISNVFRWLLDSEGTHKLGYRFVHLFIDELNRQLGEGDPLPKDDYWVRQEINTSLVPGPGDIADIVLESKSTVIVIENYFTSDGHGHNFHAYRRYAERDGRRGVVSLLCLGVDHSLQTLGWENAPVLTYASLVQRLHDLVSGDRGYQRANPEAYVFIRQFHRKFVTGRGPMEDRDVLDFVVAMCDSGEARRYQEQRQAVAAEQFASDLAVQARERFGEGRQLLHQLKGRLKSYSVGPLVNQLNDTLGEGFVRGVSARYAGIYQWTINFDIDDPGEDIGEGRLQIKFGPTAWFANERDAGWEKRLAPGTADYSRLFITRAALKEIRQSQVSLEEVLEGLDPSDFRLHDEIVALMRSTPGEQYGPHGES